ncbi:hypothetical protein VKT23_002451 [Stygiomarasmius scandens]|uniref:DUF4048 domain-containing protein n=1 Tax=Marasmiellus scandens TaxID=2682957 RepID=A0ABR1K3Y4_9AGAR
MTTTTGPRPLSLRLADDTPSSPSTPSKTNFASSSRAPNPRRQSSISYIHSRDGEPPSPALFTPRHANPYTSPNSPNSPVPSSSKSALTRSSSLGSRRSVDGLPTRTPTTPVSERPNGKPNFRNPHRTSTGSMLETTVEEQQRPPLTLVEKHAELLHFIAQKESKCLELRTQLAAHEAELLELKKKWERIVSRGFERSQSQLSSEFISSNSLKSPVPLASTSPPSNLYSAASLSYLENLSTQAQGAGSAAVFEALGGISGMKGIRDSVQQGVGRFLGVVAGSNGPVSPHSPSPLSAAMRKDFTHNPSQSTSSVATSTSLFGTGSDAGTRLSHSSQSSAEESHQDDSKRRPPSLSNFVTDTGATPLMSPTSEFGFSFDSSEATTNCTSVSRSNSVRSRRKSKQSPLKENKSADSSPSGESGKDHQESESLSSSLLDWSSLEDSSALREAKQMNNYAKRMSLPLDGSMSSWVGNMVGRKWEDTLHKNQKRASVLLSDVSQTITQLVSPPLSTSGATQSPLAVESTSTSSISRSPSLLDDDLPDSEENGDALRSMPLLQPSTPTPTSQMLQPLQARTKPMTVSPKSSPSKQRSEDDDDEWNW